MNNFLLSPDIYGGNEYDFCIEHHDTGTRVCKTITETNNKLTFNDVEHFKQFCRLYNVNIDFTPIAQQKALTQLNPNIDFSRVEWWRAMGFQRYIQHLENAGNQFAQKIHEFDLTYWNEQYQSYIDHIFYSMYSTKIDVNKYKEYYSESNLSQREVLKTFKPIDQYSKKPIYSGVSTRTGRLKIIDGANILHLKREYRDMLISSHGNHGRIVYLDYSSIEPRVLLAASKPLLIGRVPQDIYQTMLSDLNLSGIVPRTIAKTVILSILYGQGESATVQTLSKYIDNPEDFVRLVIEYFGIESLKQRLVSDLLKSSGRYILNGYGRPIWCEDTKPYALLNYYVQSTAVDIALSGFMNIINRLKRYDLMSIIRPVFILHDGIFFDVHEDAYHILPKLEKLGSKNIKGYENVDFYLRME